ncbi:hypothetical protein DITRI_Ditri18aG0114500 [Diplodiscus trichospermus]
MIYCARIMNPYVWDFDFYGFSCQMGRGKLSMKLIEHEKTRAKTLAKRMKGLKKKAHEFSILCDVKVCMIIFEPRSKESTAKVEVWPSDPIQVNSIIEKFRSSEVQKKIFSLSNFFNIRKRQVDDKVAQVRKANLKAKFPTWDDRIDNFSPEQIASFLTKLDSNIEVVKRKIMLMKGDDHDHLMQSSESRPNPFYYIPAKPLNIQVPSLSPADEALVKLSLSLSPIDKSLRMPLMNNTDFRVHSGIASSSSSIPNNVMYHPPPPMSVRQDPRIGMPNNNVMFNRPSIPVLHDPRSIAMQNNVVFKEPKRAFQTCFYTPSMQPELANYNPPQLMMSVVVPQMLPSAFTDFYHDINGYQNKNKKKKFDS